MWGIKDGRGHGLRPMFSVIAKQTLVGNTDLVARKWVTSVSVRHL